MNKNYQQIISKGEGIVPLILEELKERPSHWFWALEMITNENPVKTGTCRAYRFNGARLG